MAVRLDPDPAPETLEIASLWEDMSPREACGVSEVIEALASPKEQGERLGVRRGVAMGSQLLGRRVSEGALLLL